MILVTGVTGFIGSRTAELLSRDYEILGVDRRCDTELRQQNLQRSHCQDYIDADLLLDAVNYNSDRLPKITAVIHQGASVDTTDRNREEIMRNNTDYTRSLYRYCQHHRIPLIAASSAAVYGRSMKFAELTQNEEPINYYAESKLRFDRFLRSELLEHRLQAPVTTLRYFNVYGPGEAHKARMASTVYHFSQQILNTGVCRLFEGSGGYGPGEQQRDFVYVDDIVRIVRFFLEQDNVNLSGIYNAGTGQARTFNAVANAVIKTLGRGRIEYIPFPEDLKAGYQSYTEADITRLRQAGYQQEFTQLEQGISLTLAAAT